MSLLLAAAIYNFDLRYTTIICLPITKGEKLCTMHEISIFKIIYIYIYIYTLYFIIDCQSINANYISGILDLH